MGSFCCCFGKNSSSDFEKECLDAHNKYRKQHGAPNLVFDRNLSKFANEWAKSLANKSTLEHRSNNKYGENLYYQMGNPDFNGETAVDSWYNEKASYNFGINNPSNFSQVGHFTQVVWKGSQRMGVGLAHTSNQAYVVCNYDPPGNVTGCYKDNVLPQQNN